MLILCRNNIGNCNFISILLTIILFHCFFLCLSFWQSYSFSWVPLIVRVNNLTRAADLVLWFPKTSVSTHSWHQNGIVFMVPLNLTKSNCGSCCSTFLTIVFQGCLLAFKLEFSTSHCKLIVIMCGCALLCWKIVLLFCLWMKSRWCGLI